MIGNVIAGIISILAIIGSALWFYKQPGYEPAVTTLAGLAGLFWSVPFPFRKNKEFIRAFDALKARWHAEEKLKPASLDDARWLLSQVLDYLNGFRVKSKAKYYSKIDDLTFKVKSVQNMDILIDGGVTYKKFWKDGSELLEDIHSLTKKI